MLYVLHPYFVPGTSTTQTYPLRDIHERVAKGRAQGGIEVVNLTGTFASLGGDWRRWWATRYNSHPNPAAYHIAARAIA